MRPEDFSPGNGARDHTAVERIPGFNEAGGFLPRKLERTLARRDGRRERFNEAGGFLPRKPEVVEGAVGGVHAASMRPEDFSPGNTTCASVAGALPAALQ